MANFLLASELLSLLNEIVAKNPEAKLVTDANNGDWLVLDTINTTLDPDGDASFTLRAYSTGDKVAINEIIYED